MLAKVTPCCILVNPVIGLIVLSRVKTPSELITNTNDAWDIKIVGDVNKITQLTKMYSPAKLENYTRDLHSNPSSNNHTLFIVEPRVIDVADLLCWVNLKHTTFIDEDWSFALHRNDTVYSNTFINLSYIPTQ